MISVTGLIKTFVRHIRAALLQGQKFHCPICTGNYRRFLPAGVDPRPHAMCPRCGSLERHRLLLSVLTNLWDNESLPKGGRMLHVAPEPALAKLFRRNFDYRSVDRDGSRADLTMDITALAFPDAYFDAVVCNHVLEHVPDDGKAISELCRVMKMGAWGSIQVPMVGNVTDEDISITDPDERRRRYGQEDHVRMYGRDYLERLRSGGFEVLVINKYDMFDSAALERLSVACEDEVVLVRRRG